MPLNIHLKSQDRFHNLTSGERLKQTQNLDV